MTLDDARIECIDTALQMARSGNFGDIDDVEASMHLNAPSKPYECLKDPSVRRQVDKLCALAKLDQYKARRSQH